MNQTVRGIVIFATVLITIGIWAPLRNHPTRLPSGAVLTETYFGVLTYLTLRTETKEPEFKFQWFPNYRRLAATGAITIALWTAVLLSLRGSGRAPSDLPTNSTDQNPV